MKARRYCDNERLHPLAVAKRPKPSESSSIILYHVFVTFDDIHFNPEILRGFETLSECRKLENR